MQQYYEQAKDSIDNMVYDRNFLQIIREVVSVCFKRLKGVSKKTGIGRFLCLFESKFFSKMTLFGVILC